MNEESKENTTDNFTTELFREFKRQQTGRTIVASISIIGLVIIIIVGICAYSKSEKEWKDLFSSYDYVSQDGEGINNINSGTQGDLSNLPDEE